MPSSQDREAMIREAAYYRYLNHGCSDGHDLEDWLGAEAEMEAQAKPRLSLKIRPTVSTAADKAKRVVSGTLRGSVRLPAEPNGRKH